MKKLKVNFTTIERLMAQAKTYNLEGQLKIDFEEAIERMYHQKYIKVYGEKIPQELVRERLKNISYEHIACADNSLPREKVNGIWQNKNTILKGDLSSEDSEISRLFCMIKLLII